MFTRLMYDMKEYVDSKQKTYSNSLYVNESNICILSRKLFLLYPMRSILVVRF